MEIELPIFGKVKLEEETWEYKFQARKNEYDFEGTPVDLDVHFITVDEERVAKVSAVLNQLSKVHLIGKNAIHKDVHEGEVVNEYIEEWKEDGFVQILSEDQYQKFIENTDKGKEIEERLLSLIRIVRIGIYTESTTSFVTMDFAFGYEDIGFRDDMLVVTLNPKLEVTDICTEG